MGDGKQRLSLNRDKDICTQQQKRKPSAVVQEVIRNKVADEPCNNDRGEIKRPNAQDAPDIKGFHVDGPAPVLFFQQELCNEIGAEQEKHAHAEAARRPRHGEQLPSELLPDRPLRPDDNIGPMMNQHTEKSKESQCIEFRPVIPLAFFGLSRYERCWSGNGKDAHSNAIKESSGITIMALSPYPKKCDLCYPNPYRQ